MLTLLPIETPRLVLRPETVADTESIYAMNSDPEVMRFVATPWTSPLSEFIEQHHAALSRIADKSYGGVAVILKETGVFIGLCWLVPGPLLDNEIELGYRYVRSAWGKGYATEAGRAVLSEAWERLGIGRVLAMARPQNRASLRVLEKLGFQYIPQIFHPRYQCNVPVCRIERPKPAAA
jgi:RimJ/RimL family protein N-acetyltransferase